MNKVLASKALFGSVLTVMVTGCGVFADRSDQYKEAGVLEAITLPEGISAKPMESAFAVPQISVNEFDYIDSEEDIAVPRPSAMSQDSEYARVKIQKVADRRWVLAEAPTSQVWPLVQSFLARNGISVDKARPKTGEIETAWLSFKVDAETKSRYRIRIEKGVREESSEVHVLHQQLATGAQPVAWPALSSNSEREAWMLDELAVSIAQGISNRAASLLGQSVGGQEKIQLRREGEEPILEIRLDRERTQATLSHALNQEGLRIWTEETEHGLIYFDYDDPNKEPGFWRKITLRGNDDVPEFPPVELRSVLSSMAPNTADVFGDIPGFAVQTRAKASEGYLLRAQQQGNKIVVRVRNTRGELLPFREAKQLMFVIRRNLI